MNVRRGPAWVALGLLLAAGAAGASEEDIATWRSVTVVARPSRPFEEVRVTAEIEGEGWDRRLKTLKVVHGGKELAVPAEAIRAVRNPRLDTLRISTEAGYDPWPWLYVSVVQDRPGPGVEWEFPRVVFAFQNDAFVRTHVRKTAPPAAP